MTLLLLAGDGTLEERVGDGMYVISVAWGTGLACEGEGARDEGDATVEGCGFL
jgi:hypothetical protein